MKKAQSLFLSIAAAIGIFVIGNVVILIAQQPNTPPDMTIDQATRAQVIESLVKDLNEAYVFPETAKKMEADVRSRMKNKEYDTLTSAREFAQKLTDDLQAISKDKHLRVRFSKNAIPVRKDREAPTAEELAEETNYMRRINFGFERIERMPGNIGYVDLRGFFHPKDGAETVASAMNFLSNTDALIFDLRQNGGGDPEMVALISSYLFGDKPVHLNSLYWRKGDRTEDFYTKPNLANKKFGDRDVYVLTSNYTFSGAEEFSYNLKNLKRATIVGETTGGGANPGGMFRLSEHFGAFIPTGRAVSPITKTNWEGTGVEPDVKAPKEQALKIAYLMALNKSVEKTKDEDFKNALKRTIEQTQKELDELKAKK
ncbi:MAG: interphotoreceptor retinoid-binding protein [uncultured Pyrinomonadaceae bacterium]|uniref:Interphotoreceptor retinoid-binding protein n=1 Tax=uncultured Pyrinomonadaceae bacterium TaxID=2283094 RepID=A0A6J4NG25_9BACT|nr:MAG: interphotoreceptor retinoid-binding protein [uncultured Pyrinomonadaceae bacterium]